MIFEEVRDMLADQFKIDPSQITMDSSLKNDLHADSLDALDILMNLEDAFDISIPDREASTTVGQLVRYIESRVSVVPQSA